MEPTTIRISFGDFVSDRPETNLVELAPNAWHRVRIVRTVECTDRNASLTEPTLKEKVPEWVDPTAQLAVIFQGKDGSIIHRYNACGFKRFDELPVKEQKNFYSVNGYAVGVKNKMRVVDPKRTGDAVNIFNNLFASCKKLNETTGVYEVLPIGSSVIDLKGSELEVFVDSHVYEGKNQLRVTKTRRFSELVTADKDF